MKYLPCKTEWICIQEYSRDTAGISRSDLPRPNALDIKCWQYHILRFSPQDDVLKWREDLEGCYKLCLNVCTLKCFLTLAYVFQTMIFPCLSLSNYYRFEIAYLNDVNYCKVQECCCYNLMDKGNHFKSNNLIKFLCSKFYSIPHHNYHFIFNILTQNGTYREHLYSKQQMQLE